MSFEPFVDCRRLENVPRKSLFIFESTLAQRRRWISAFHTRFPVCSTAGHLSARERLIPLPSGNVPIDIESYHPLCRRRLTVEFLSNARGWVASGPNATAVVLTASTPAYCTIVRRLCRYTNRLLGDQPTDRARVETARRRATMAHHRPCDWRAQRCVLSADDQVRQRPMRRKECDRPDGLRTARSRRTTISSRTSDQDLPRCGRGRKEMIRERIRPAPPMPMPAVVRR